MAVSSQAAPIDLLFFVFDNSCLELLEMGLMRLGLKTGNNELKEA